MTLPINHKFSGYFSVYILPSLLGEFNIVGYSLLLEIFFLVYITPHMFSTYVPGQASNFTGFSPIVLPLRLCSSGLCLGHSASCMHSLGNFIHSYGLCTQCPLNLYHLCGVFSRSPDFYVQPPTQPHIPQASQNQCESNRNHLSYKPPPHPVFTPMERIGTTSHPGAQTQNLASLLTHSSSSCLHQWVLSYPPPKCLSAPPLQLHTLLQPWYNLLFFSPRQLLWVLKGTSCSCCQRELSKSKIGICQPLAWNLSMSSGSSSKPYLGIHGPPCLPLPPYLLLFVHCYSLSSSLSCFHSISDSPGAPPCPLHLANLSVSSPN